MLHKTKTTSTKHDTELSQRQSRIYSFLKSNPAGVLATVDPNSKPHATVIYQTIDRKDFSIFFITKTATKKYDVLSHNNNIMLVVSDNTSQTMAQVTGTAHEISNHAKVNEIAQAVNDALIIVGVKYVPPISKLNAGEYVAFQIVPDQIRMVTFSKPKTGEYADLFDSLESYELKTDY